MVIGESCSEREETLRPAKQRRSVMETNQKGARAGFGASEIAADALRFPARPFGQMSFAPDARSRVSPSSRVLFLVADNG